MTSSSENHSPNFSHNGSPRSRRRSSLAGLNTADPHHHRQPSLGELHQQLENEQEAQVNRLLHMIRIQQDQIASIQRGNTDQAAVSPDAASSSAIIDQSSPRSGSFSGHASGNRPHSHSMQLASRHSITGSTSHGSSPSLRPVSSNLSPLAEDYMLNGNRDDSAYYQAETQTLTRENQMLKQRIRELERQISELSTSSPTLQRPPSQQGQASSPLTSPQVNPSNSAASTAPTNGESSNL